MGTLLKRFLGSRDVCLLIVRGKATHLEVGSSLTPKILSCCGSSLYGQNITPAMMRPPAWSVYSSRVKTCSIYLQQIPALGPGSRAYSKAAGEQPNEDPPPEEKLSLFKRFKQMYRDYWYVLLPVHVATSAVWVVGLYYLATSGVDVVGLLETMGAGEKITGLLKNSQTGYFALTYALYKIATPARYTVTLGGTTVAINYLKRWGYIKPIPPKEKLKEMYQERRDNFKDNLKERTGNFFKPKHKD